MDLVVALDAGTTGVRALSFDATSTQVDLAYRELTQHFPSPGLVEHDADEIARLSLDVLTEVATMAQERGDTVVAVGLTNQRETVVAFDLEAPGALHHALVWQDRRGAERCAQLSASAAAERVRQVSGLVIDPYFSATKMEWLLAHGVLDAARCPALGTIDTWLTWSLSGASEGGTFIAEASNASRTMLMDLEHRHWSDELCGIFGVDVGLLAPVVASGGDIARISPAVCAPLGNVPITGILGDQQAALFGQACFIPGMVKATYGTGAFVLANAGTSTPSVTPGLLSTLAWDDGDEVVYAYEGSSFVAGAAVQWLRDELGLIERAEDLEALARSVADNAGVSIVPAFVGLGSPFWRPSARGSISGLSGATSRAHVARALVEALAFQVRAITDAFTGQGMALSELRADGGAAAMDLLLQLQATASRLPVARSAHLEATARGAASLAGEAAGLWSREELSDLWSAAKRFEPEDATFLDLNYEAWLRALERS